MLRSGSGSWSPVGSKSGLKTWQDCQARWKYFFPASEVWLIWKVDLICYCRRPPLTPCWVSGFEHQDSGVITQQSSSQQTCMQKFKQINLLLLFNLWFDEKKKERNCNKISKIFCSCHKVWKLCFPVLVIFTIVKKADFRKKAKF